MGKDLKGKDLGKGIRQRSDGKYYARFCSKTGKRPVQSFKKLQEARIWLEEQRYLDKHENIAIINKVTLDAWYSQWEENINRCSVRNTTQIMYRDNYERIISPVIGKMLLSDIKPIHCQEVLNQNEYAYNSLSSAKTRMKQLFDTAVENGLLNKSLLTNSVKLPANNTKERLVLSSEEQDIFMDYINKRKLKHRDAYVFVLETGLRCGEMMGLKWEDVDFEKKCIHIRRTLIYVTKTKTYEEHEPKTARANRIVPLTDTALEVLKRRKSKKVLGMYVFQGEDGKITSNIAYNKGMADACLRIGIEPISMHALRHSFATRCIERGMNPKTLQKILGHSKLSITMDLYVHVLENTLFDEMKKVGSISKVG